MEAFKLHLVTTTYGEGEGAAGKAECWTKVIKMVRIIWRDLSRVRVEAETLYGSDNLTEMVGKYPWGTL